MTNDKPKVGMTSVEAAALYLSDGATTDPILATHMDQGGSGFDMDALQRSHLTRMMGFQFDIEVNEFENYIKVWSTEGPEVTVTTKYDGVFNDETVNLVVDTCLTVKEKWDEQQKPKDEAIEGEVVEAEDNV